MKTAHKADNMARRHHKKRAAREQQRKLKRKLCHIVEELGLGHYQGVKDSPLLRANKGLAINMLRRRYGFGG